MQKNSAKIGFIFITVLVDVIGLAIIIPVLPKLLDHLIGVDVNEASIYGGVLISVSAFMMFLCAPLMGELSDRFGRRPVLLLALVGLTLDYLFHAIAPNFTFLLITRAIAGIVGSSFSVANAYIADISEPHEKAKNFGLLGAAFGLGFVIGPAIGGLAGKYSVELPFYIASGLTFLNLIYGLFVIPESLPKEKRRSFDIKRANPIGAIRHLWKYKLIRSMFIALFISYVAHHAVESTWPYYTKYTLGWGTDEIGISLAVVGVLVVIIQVSVINRFIKWFGEHKTIFIGYVFWLCGLILFGTVTNTWAMYIYMIPYVLGGIAEPTIQSILSNQVNENEQGELSGAMTSLRGLTTIIGPLLMTNLFFHFTEKSSLHLPGSPFFLGALLLIITMFIIYKSLDLGNKKGTLK